MIIFSTEEGHIDFERVTKHLQECRECQKELKTIAYTEMFGNLITIALKKGIGYILEKAKTKEEGKDVSKSL